jgi:hypothetical protein
MKLKLKHFLNTCFTRYTLLAFLLLLTASFAIQTVAAETNLEQKSFPRNPKQEIKISRTRARRRH